MKPYLVAFTAALATLAVAASAQYAIDWHTIDGGGGTSSGGTFAVSGTIGQPDAGATMTGGVFSVTGGFWALYAVQTEGAPFLSIEPAGPGQAAISWEPDVPGWILQEATSLILTNWTDAPSGATNPVTIPASTSPKFFRLFKH